MLINEPLGFRSSFVLMKLGHDLGETLSETVDAPLPERWHSLVERVSGGVDEPRTLELRRSEYVRLY